MMDCKIEKMEIPLYNGICADLLSADIEETEMVTVYMVSRDKTELTTDEQYEDEGAIVYAHGGGAVCLSAEKCMMEICQLAVTMETKVYAVEVSKVTNKPCPRAQIEFATVLYNLVDEINGNGKDVDKEKLMVCGVGSGAWVTMGATIILERKGFVDIIKYHMLVCPDISCQLGLKANNLLQFYERPWQNHVISRYKKLFTGTTKPKTDSEGDMNADEDSEKVEEEV